ncbi:MAG: hypothetical protein KGD63_03915 [Candidatus Lokiarchaeota archaeon]|nr:hypothetical protein [Candidatus Lokiarchaeota archaeon]
MIPKSIFERIIGVDVYIHIKDLSEKFSGKLLEITDDDLISLEDKYNNITYISRKDICVITERR